MTEQIWELITGANPLREIYGYWPTMHDAVVRTISICYEARDIEIIFDYTDQFRDDEFEIATRIAMKWSGVRDCRLQIEEANVYGIQFSSQGDFLLTHFDRYAWGFDGEICSASIEVSGIQRLPDMNDTPTEPAEPKPIRINLS